jgi:hypothetical protein
MHRFAALMLLFVALVHLLPLQGVLGAGRLQSLYGIAVDGPDLVILMRHRAVLFGLLGAYQLWAIFRPAHRTAAFVAGIASLAAFLALAFSTDGYNAAMARVVWVDVAALVMAIAGFAAHRASGRASK